ncbi:anhydro-N-acetylmuramic acid kinase [Nonlabens marinus S1-08]|uniref:Anhydro-N-acetylmuramic acid kinase n=2 Tax=Nonlabens TaxID=363408 RepID=W8VPZ4_9FLAO|nr:anhydro-N-acetylmuramic acid kinase [Nonlabens marinus S1-08]
MSGTSLDGVDLVHVELSKADHWDYKIVAQECVPYPENWKKRLGDALQYKPDALSQLNIEYTALLAHVTKKFILDHEIQHLVAVCSHGHTIWHQPDQGLTLQIGNLPEFAQLTNQRVVCDFRVQDVELGGQGAPLVPIGDQLLFSGYEYCLNLGGFANVSSDQNGLRTAYDICAVNVVLNHYASELGADFDAGGAFAKAGSPQPQQLKKLDELAFYSLQAPKSLGIEWVKEYIFPILEEIPDTKNALATYTEHVAKQIASNLAAGSKVLVTGGGAYNDFLLERIQHYKSLQIVVPEATLLEYKEALIFALLGVLRLRNENNCLSSVTGASRDHCSGKIYTP